MSTNLTCLELTESERANLQALGGSPRKALRIIDAHAADRAALVAQLEAARREARQLELRLAAATEILLKWVTQEWRRLIWGD